MQQEERSVTEPAPPCPNPRCALTRTALVLEREVARPKSGTGAGFVFRFAVCPRCGLGFVDPIPDPQTLAGLYGEDYDYWQPPGDLRSLRLRAKAWLARLRFRGRLRPGGLSSAAEAVARGVERLSRRDISYSLAIPAALPATARLLDYGCGSGVWLLGMLEQGRSDLHGFDLAANRASLDRLRDAGLQVSSQPPWERYGERSFDCIRLEHVLEHLPRPEETLRRLRPLLRPGGLLVATVPSIHAWEPVESIPASPYRDHLQLPIHLFHHSRGSLRDFLLASGFEGIEVRGLRPHGYLSACAAAGSAESR